MSARAWTNAEVARLLYVATALPPSDPQGARFWQAAEQYGSSEHPIDGWRLRRAAAKAYALVERRLDVVVRQLAQQLHEQRASIPMTATDEAWLRRQLEGLRGSA